jgi:hypothetical protein
MLRCFTFLLLFTVGISAATYAQTAGTTPSETAALEFESDTYDFGTATQGDIVKHTYKFKNTGNADLRLSGVKPSCGCTTPSFTTDPIKPGKTGQIEVSFNTAAKMGEQFKSITVTANTQPPQKILILKGKVILVQEQAPAPSAGLGGAAKGAQAPTPVPETATAPR